MTTESDPEPARPQVQPWHKQPFDTRISWHAFVHYRDLPAWSRSIDQAYANHKEQCEKDNARQSDINSASDDEGKRASRHWFGWSAANDWEQRAILYDQFKDERRSRRRSQEIDDALDQVVTLTRTGLLRAAQRLRFMAADEIQPSHLDRWIKNLSELQLKALGWVDTKGIELAGPGGGPIEIEEHLDMEKLLSDPETRKALEILGMQFEEEAE